VLQSDCESFFTIPKLCVSAVVFAAVNLQLLLVLFRYNLTEKYNSNDFNVSNKGCL
jgi:hypothetical protein